MVSDFLYREVKMEVVMSSLSMSMEQMLPRMKRTLRIQVAVSILAIFSPK